MKFNAQYYTLIALIIVSLTAYYYHSALQKERHVTTQQQEDIQQLTDTINYQNSHITMLNELDDKHTNELAHAKSKITQLSDDLRTNIKRVYVKAQCPVRETPSPSGVDGSGSARLEKDAEQDYVRLLGELETLEAQYVGLRDYVNTECGRKE
ncbi:lysis protein [Photorhabdus khanii]|uniref:Lysis protein n=1 Tax=Photorhabdus khanii subsp. guanajuatensis TaxID=2100166 RepID=A0A4R4J412_9GAMM|nr:lysis protein [Photorhabdus khanii]TDB48250.1 lysis protein [Photorhabdus khanii subsp. guanajuatensis]